MDDATKQALNLVVQQAIAAAQAGAKWTADQAPLLVQEWLRWYAASSIFWMALGLLGLCVALSGAAYVGRNHEEMDEEIGAFVARVSLGVGAVGFLVLASNAFDLVKVLVAPRVVIIEQLAHWLK